MSLLKNIREQVFTAEWRNLLFFNYHVEAEPMFKYLPEGCELDLWQGRPQLSLVAYQASHTDVFGLKIPGLRHFLQVELCLYVRYRGRRGVRFIKKFVPSRMMAMAGRVGANENFETARTDDKVLRRSEIIEVDYSLARGTDTMRLRVQARAKPFRPAQNSTEHFFKERRVSVSQKGAEPIRHFNYIHPTWRVFPVQIYDFKMDAEALWGPDFAALATRFPDSVVLCEGSRVGISLPHREKPKFIRAFKRRPESALLETR